MNRKKKKYSIANSSQRLLTSQICRVVIGLTNEKEIEKSVASRAQMFAKPLFAQEISDTFLFFVGWLLLESINPLRDLHRPTSPALVVQTILLISIARTYT